MRRRRIGWLIAASSLLTVASVTPRIPAAEADTRGDQDASEETRSGSEEGASEDDAPIPDALDLFDRDSVLERIEDESADSASADATAGVPGASSTLDRVDLLDGSALLGAIVRLDSGSLTIRTAFGVDEIVTVSWSQVKGIRSDRKHVFVLADGSVLSGPTTASPDGTISIRTELIAEASTFRVTEVTAINPPPRRGVILTGDINAGASISDGNAQNKAANLTGEVVARSERQRLTLKGFWNYAEDDVKVTVRNVGGGAKYDYFFKDIDERLFGYSSVVLLKDEFEDLNLRTAISAGPGYQILEKGDFESPALEGLQVYGEAGLAYFHEDRRSASSRQHLAVKWGLKLDWRIIPSVRVFHNHELYPGLKELSDLYVTTEQGVRVDLGMGFTAGFQVNWRWNSTPSPGFERSTATYIFTLGYDFEI